jgi:hypothetical protein
MPTVSNIILFNKFKLMCPSNPLIIPILVAFAVLSSCKKDHDSPSAKPVRYITEKDTFKTDAIWYADTIYNMLNKLKTNPYQS